MRDGRPFRSGEGSSGGAETIGDEGTGGNADGCRLLKLSLKLKRDANPNVDLVGGADGGGRSLLCMSLSVNDRCLPSISGRAVGGGGKSSRNDEVPDSFFQSGEELFASEDSVVSPLGLLIDRLGASNQPPTPSSSCSSPSSMRFSSRMLPDVKLLVTEPAR